MFASKGEIGGNVRCGAKWASVLSDVVELRTTVSDFLRDQNEGLLEIVFGDPLAADSLPISFSFLFPLTSAEPNLRKDEAPNDTPRVLRRRSSSLTVARLSCVKFALIWSDL